MFICMYVYMCVCMYIYIYITCGSRDNVVGIVIGLWD